MADKKSSVINQIEAFLANPENKPEALAHKDLQVLLHNLSNMYAELELQHDELLRAQDELEKARKKLELLQNKSPFGIALVDQDAIIRYTNHTFDQLFADHLHSRPGGDLRKMLSPEMQDEFEQFFSKVKKNNGSYQTKTFKFDNHSGRVLWIKVSADTFENDNENLSYLFVFENVTGEITAQKALDETNQLLRHIAENSVDIIAVFDHKLTIEWISPSISRTGWNPESMIGRSALEFIHPEDHQVMLRALSCRIEKLDFGVSEYRFKNPDGQWLWSEATGKMLVDKDGIPMKLLVVSRLIDQRKAAEKALRDSNYKLKDANQTKDKLFSIIAHDLRSPFNAILGLAEIMADEQFELDLLRIRQLSQNLHKTAMSAFMLLEDLLEWSRLQRNLIQPEIQPMDVKHLLAELIDLFKSECAQKEIVIEQDIALKTSTIHNDRRLLFVLLRNLLSNAIKFSHKGGKVTVRFWESAERKLCIAVTDHGIGIPANLIPLLFSIDDQKTRPGTLNEKSSGLGLIITRDMVRLLGGEIEVDSVEGHGSTFYVTIPLESPRK